MSTPYLRRSLSIVLSSAIALTGLTALATPAHAAFTSTVGGDITRSEVMERAQYWLDHQPGPYTTDGSGYSPDPTGSRNYRRDCSGYVDMAWHTSTDNTTYNMANISTEINRSDLQPGDILNDEQHHVILFKQWDDGAHTTFDYYSFGSTPVKLKTNISINAAEFDSHPNSEYVARRYIHIKDDVPMTGVDGSGGRVATAVHTSGQVEVFAVTPAGRLQQRFESSPGGAWSGWFDFGPATGTVTSVATARHVSGQIEVYAVMSDGSIMNKFETAPGAPWSPWYSWAPAGTATALTAAVHVSGQVELFAVTPTGGIKQRFESTPGGAWSGWFDFGPTTGTVTSIATSRHATGQIEVYAVLSDGSIMDKFETAPGAPWTGWMGWAPAGTAIATGVPGAISTGVHTSGQVEVFVVTPAGGIRQRFESSPGGAWSGWFDFGPTGTVRELAASRHASGQVEVYAVLPDGSISDKFETAPGAAWTGWMNWAPAGTATA